MRKLLALTVLAIFASATLSPALAYQQGQEGQGQQGQEQQARTFRGTLQTVDVEAQTLSVTYSEDTDPVTVEVQEDTTLQGPEGDMTLADLAEHQGEDLEIRYVMEQQNVIALEVRLVA